MLVHELRRQLAAARLDVEEHRRRNYELNQRLAEMQQLVTKLNTDRMIAQRDAEVSAIKIGHLMAQITRLETQVHLESINRFAPPYAPD